MRIIISILLLSASLSQASLDRFQCLSMIETRDNDGARGNAGEVSRFAITPKVWRQYTRLPLSAARNPFTVYNVAVDVMRDRETAFNLRYHREATDYEWACLWHCPSRRVLTVAEKDYAQRFVNLRSVK